MEARVRGLKQVAKQLNSDYSKNPYSGYYAEIILDRKTGEIYAKMMSEGSYTIFPEGSPCISASFDTICRDIFGRGVPGGIRYSARERMTIVRDWAIGACEGFAQ